LGPQLGQHEILHNGRRSCIERGTTEDRRRLDGDDVIGVGRAAISSSLLRLLLLFFDEVIVSMVSSSDFLDDAANRLRIPNEEEEGVMSASTAGPQRMGWSWK